MPKTKTRNIGHPVFAQPEPTADPTIFKVNHPSDDPAYKVIDELNKEHKVVPLPFPVPRGGQEPTLTLAFTPWGELFVVSQANGMLSRFTFDATHAAVPNGTYQIPGPTITQQGGLGWILIVPGASTAVDGGVSDSGVASAAKG